MNPKDEHESAHADARFGDLRAWMQSDAHRKPPARLFSLLKMGWERDPGEFASLWSAYLEGFDRVDIGCHGAEELRALQLMLSEEVLSRVVLHLDATKGALNQACLDALSALTAHVRLESLDLSGHSPAEAWGRLYAMDGLTDVRTLHISNCRLNAQRCLEVFSSTIGRRVERLDLSYNHLDLASIEALDSTGVLSRVTRLDLSQAVRDEVVMRLAELDPFQELRTLFMSHCYLRDSAGIALLEADGLRRLRALSLDHNDLSAAFIDALSESAALEGLERLDLSSNKLYLEGSARSLAALLESPKFANVRALSVSNISDGDVLLRALLASPFTRQLERLYLAGVPVSHGLLGEALEGAELDELDIGANHMDEDAFLEIMSALNPETLEEIVYTSALSPRSSLQEMHDPWSRSTQKAREGARLPRLRTLRARHCSLRPEHALALAKSTGLRSLRRIVLDDEPHNVNKSKIGDRGLELLASHRTWKIPAEFRTNNFGLGPNAMVTMATGSRFSHCTSLDLTGAQFDERSMRAFTRQGTWPELRKLCLEDSNLDDATLSILARAQGLPKLRDLDLSETQVTDAGVMAVARGALMQRLDTLCLSYNEIGDASMAALADAPGIIRLKRLDLRHIGFGLEGLERLVASPNFVSLEHLDLGRPNVEFQASMGLAMARALARAPWLSNLSSLAIHQWNMGDEGMLALLDAGLGTSLQALGMRGNDVGDLGTRALLDGAPGLTRLDYVGRAHARHVHPNRASREMYTELHHLFGYV